METVDEVESNPSILRENSSTRMTASVAIANLALNSDPVDSLTNTVGRSNMPQRGVRRLNSASLTSSSGGGPSVGVLKRTGSIQAGHAQRGSRGTERARSLRSNELRPLGKGCDSASAASGGTRVPPLPSHSSGGRNPIRGALARTSSSSTASGGAGIVPLSRSRITPPTRGLSASTSGGLRPYTRDQMVNTQIERRLNDRMAGPGGTLQRRVSERSSNSDDAAGCTAGRAMEFDSTRHSMISAGGDQSLYTMDSIHLRKGQQVIADPLDDKSYVYAYGDDDCSFADHDTYVTRVSNEVDFDFAYNVSQPGVVFGSAAPRYDGASEARNNATKNLTDRLRRMGITENVADDQSMASGLTNDFTDFGFDDDDFVGEDDDQYYDYVATDCPTTTTGPEHDDEIHMGEVSDEDDDHLHWNGDLKKKHVVTVPSE